MAHIRYRVHARSIRSGILVARGIQYEPGGWIDWDLFLRAYLRTKDAATTTDREDAPRADHPHTAR